MVKLSKESKQRLQQVFRCTQFAIRWGFIPTVLYLGFRRGGDPGMPEPNLLRWSNNILYHALVWPGKVPLQINSFIVQIVPF
ncbi:mitochondrial import receptor subunit TOM7 homolog [Narcine bancroftii]|uniref:mitochondrial import receptor subunit TOM7 homolog n=1 Tax=Narcine bancroftii TaxID=1343680 RepID=UPI003831951B